MLFPLNLRSVYVLADMVSAVHVDRLVAARRPDLPTNTMHALDIRRVVGQHRHDCTRHIPANDTPISRAAPYLSRPILVITNPPNRRRDILVFLPRRGEWGRGQVGRHAGRQAARDLRAGDYYGIDPALVLLELLDAL